MSRLFFVLRSWCLVRSRSAVLGSLVAIAVVARVPMIAAGPSTEPNVVFGTYSGLALLMDVHKPATPNGYGIVVIPGSGWQREFGYDAAMLKDSGEFKAAQDKLVSVGYTLFVINHRATPGFHMQEIVSDAERAVRFVRAHAVRFGIRADRIGALGGSSGGHLVNLLGTMDGNGDAQSSDPIQRESSKVQAVVAFYSPADLAKIETPLGVAALTAAMDGVFPPGVDRYSTKQKIASYRQASPITYVSADDAPFLLVHGDKDGVVPFQQSEMMETALRAAGVPVKLVRVPDGAHGARGPAWEKVDWPALTVEWFDTHLLATNGRGTKDQGRTKDQ